jgi:ATP synthase F1 gamma subunit
VISSYDFQKKINTLIDVGDIVNAFKAYAAATVRRTEEVVLNIREYEMNLLRAMADIMGHFPEMSVEKRDKGKRLLVAFGSSQGMCGAYNERIAEAVSGTVRADDSLFIIGRRLRTAADSRRITYDIYRDFVVSVSGIDTVLGKILSDITEVYKGKQYYDLTLLFTYVSEKKATVFTERILPPNIEKVKALRPAETLPLTYVKPGRILEDVLEEFLFISLYRCCLESLRSENWYRLRSLEGASENIEKNISELKTLQNYARQEEITEEMIEILGSGMFYGKK